MSPQPFWQEPTVDWKRSGGPVLVMRDGVSIQKLTWMDRFMLWIGIVDIVFIERVVWHQTRPHRREGT